MQMVMDLELQGVFLQSGKEEQRGVGWLESRLEWGSSSLQEEGKVKNSWRASMLSSKVFTAD